MSRGHRHRVRAHGYVHDGRLRHDRRAHDGNQHRCQWRDGRFHPLRTIGMTQVGWPISLLQADHWQSTCQND